MVTCAQCGLENPEAAKFCMECGGPLAPAQGAGEERRLVSVLFVDLVGSTARAEQLDPEDVAAFLTPYYEHVRGELERFGGAVEKFVGDAVMGIFGAPTAFGDDPERAVRAALAVRDWAEADGLEVRIAVNTGEALVDLEARPSHGEAMIAGDVVNTASRLQSAAPVGSVLVGEETYVATRNVIEYRPAQPLTLKGKQEPVHVWIALRPTTDAGERAITAVPLVGRERELQLLTGAWARVVDEQRAQFVTVFGPSGIGKTRLSLELSELVAEQGGRVIRGRSTPYGASTPYSAFAQQVKQIARIFDSDEPELAYEKLSAAVAEIAGEACATEHAPNLGILLGLVDAEGVDRETLFFSARVLVESLALRSPTLLLYEDIHWADESMLDLLETFARRVHDVPVYFVALARTELLTNRPGWGGGVPSYTALLLDPLSAEAGRELARQLLASARDGQAAAVAETAEGNPLFIEELSASLAERSTAGSGRLPTSVQAIVAARLDALPPDERRVLLDASVVGRVFWRGALNEIAPRDDLSSLLGSLEARDLIRREAVSRISGDQQFGFKHGLIHEVAYGTLPRAARRERHAAVARFLEQATAVGQSHEALGHHWREAGENERALDELEAAGDQAGRGWAKEHAIKLYGEALQLVPEDDHARRKSLRMRQIVAVQALSHLHMVDVSNPGAARPDPPSAESRPA
ncbi:MAG TPA: AAA family ATPase [Gaiellaceae bacterium]|nr:AAA family ATPase [Gaiellaceae bacterium]